MNDLYVMTPVEVARGYLTGNVGALEPPVDVSTTPRAALERIVSTALQRTPCAVAFSGGRDSSLILALAAHVARREGLEPPIPVTRAFPALPETDEREWQEQVIRHIGVEHWERVDISDELDVIGPFAQRHLARYGVVWPATIATNVPIIERVSGGTVIDGEGGDEILGADTHRIGPLSQAMRAPRRVRRADLRTLMITLGPPPVRRRSVGRSRWEASLAWLRPDPRREFVTELISELVDRPLRFAPSVEALPRRRAHTLGSRNRRALARTYDVDLVSPLWHPDFVHAMARRGRWFGPGSRTGFLYEFAGDLLPSPVIERRSKAVFNRAYIGTRAREFAQSWSGGGVDPALVDPDALRAEWLSETPHWMSAALLQTAWLDTTAGVAKLT